MLSSIPWYYIVGLAIVFVVATQCVEETMVSGPFSKIANTATLAADRVASNNLTFAQPASVTVDANGVVRETYYEGGVLLERTTSKDANGLTRVVVREVSPANIANKLVVTQPRIAAQPMIAAQPRIAAQLAPKPALQVIKGPAPLLSPSAMGPKTSNGVAPSAAKKDTALAHSEVKDSFNLSSRRRQYADLVNQYNKTKDKKGRADIADYLKRIRVLADKHGQLAALMKGMPQLR